MKVVWLERAVADLQDLRAHIAEHDPGAARRVAQRIRRTIGHLKAHPALGRPADVEDIRIVSIPGLPYLIPYRVRAGRVEILRVFHTARDRPAEWEE